METVVQFLHLSYSPDLSPCDRFLFTLLKNIYQDVNIRPKALLADPFFSVCRVWPKKSTYLHSEPGY